MPVQQWVIPPDATQQGAVRRQVVAHAAEHGVTGAVLRDLAIAASELVANVLRHEGPRRAGSIALDVRRDRITVMVRDAGAAAAPQVDGPAGHLGMVILAAVAHTVRVARTGDGRREVSMTLLRDAGASRAP